MPLSSKEIFKRIRHNFKSPVSKTEDVIAEAIEDIIETTISELQMMECVDKYKKKIIKLIYEHIEDCEEKCIEPDITFGTTEEILKRTDVKMVDAQKEFDEWLWKLDPYLFESFSKKILELEGCDNVQVTSSSGDGGIDLYGVKEIVVKDKTIPNLFKNITLLVIGQSKRYKDEIGISHLREFIGSVSMIKYSLLQNSPKTCAKPVEMKDYKPLTPLLMTFITSSKANSATSEVAKWLGVRFIDGNELGKILYRNNVGFQKYKGTVEFISSEIERLL